jgi:uncharacterized protein YjeT (DUF2065 family)
MANVVSGPYLAAGLLLIATGLAKLRTPAATRRAAHALGLRVNDHAVRGFGLGEIAVGAAALIAGGNLAYLVAVYYAVFTVVALRLLRRAPETPCGCLGASSRPVSRAHVVINVAAVFVALASVGTAPLGRISDAPVAGIVLAALALCTARLALLTFELREVTQ